VPQPQAAAARSATVNAAALNVPAAEGVVEEAVAAGAAVEVATDKPGKPDKPDKAKSRPQQTQGEPDRLPIVRVAPNKLPDAVKGAATRAERARFPLTQVAGGRETEIKAAVEDAGADSKASLARSEDA
jgi:hypothetical protein